MPLSLISEVKRLLPLATRVAGRCLACRGALARLGTIDGRTSAFTETAALCRKCGKAFLRTKDAKGGMMGLVQMAED